MAKKVNEVKDGDMISNIITLRSVFSKVGQKYFIQPHRGSNGKYAPCVKRVDSHGDMVLTREEIEKEAAGEAFYIPEDKVFEIEDGFQLNLDDVQDAAIWDAIKTSPLIAPDRFAKNANGEYLIDGTTNKATKHPRYGAAELYVDRPGLIAQVKNTKRKKVSEAYNFILNDERGYDGRVLISKLLGRNFKNQPNADVEDFLLSIAESNPDKIINAYTDGDTSLRLLFIEATTKGVIRKKQGLYVYGEDGKVSLGATDNAVITYMKQAKNKSVVALIRKETYPEMFSEIEE